MTRLALLAASTAAILVALFVTAAPEAQACGGCFAPPETVTTVDSHRMVVSLNLNRTILWDQIRYTGEPEDFAWVLPVPTPDAEIDVADNEFFVQLEQETAVTVLPPSLPPLDCPPPPGDWGSSGAVDASAAASPDAGVEVYQEDVVGPYEMVVIGSEDPMALYDWLIDHGYSVPMETLPIIQYYVEDGSKFVALRLAPEQGVDQMQPIRVAYPGYMATFPLKMVTVGAYGALDLTLWVIAEQRYAVHNYGTATIDPQSLIWDFSEGRSNYVAQFEQAIEELGGAGWVAEYAYPFAYAYYSSQEEAELAANDHPFPYLTRLRTRVNIDNLGDDLLLAPSMDSSDVSNWIQVENSVNAPDRSCPDYNGDNRPDTWDDYSDNDDRLGVGFGCAVTGDRALPTALFGLLLIGGLLLRRRRR